MTSMPVNRPVREVGKRCNGNNHSDNENSKRSRRQMAEVDYNTLPNDHLHKTCATVQSKSVQMRSEKKTTSERDSYSRTLESDPAFSDATKKSSARNYEGLKSNCELSHCLLKCIKCVVHDDNKIRLIDRPVLMAELSGLTTAEFQVLKDQLTATDFAIQKASFEYSGNVAVCDCVVGLRSGQLSSQIEVKSEPNDSGAVINLVGLPQTGKDIKCEDDDSYSVKCEPTVKSEPVSDGEGSETSVPEGRVLVKATFLLDKLLTDKCRKSMSNKFTGYRYRTRDIRREYKRHTPKAVERADEESDSKTSRKILRKRFTANYQPHIPYILKRSFASTRALQSTHEHHPSSGASTKEHSIDSRTVTARRFFNRSELRNYSYSDKLELDNKGRINDPYKPIDRHQETPATALTASEILKLKRIDDKKVNNSVSRVNNLKRLRGTVKAKEMENCKRVVVQTVMDESLTSVNFSKSDDASHRTTLSTDSLVNTEPSLLSGKPMIGKELTKLISTSSITKSLTAELQSKRVTILKLDSQKNNKV